MPAEQNESRDVPAHDKYADRHPHDGATKGICISKIFGSQEKGISTIAFHKAAVDHTKHENPENQKYLVFTKMKKQKLDRKWIKYSTQVGSKGSRVSRDEIRVLHQPQNTTKSPVVQVSGLN